ncbi:MAG: phosphate/phosphite/phosphonate ABC transporter substrate-binding protein [Nitrospinota bacterium]|nr:phosphate/phosphite/phosphonate ABC transporter substrate-binding protein [Nitrospinota bacterium]
MQRAGVTFIAIFNVVIGILSLFYCSPVLAKERLGTAQHPVRMMFVPSGEAQTILEGGEEIGRRLQKITGLHFRTSIATSYAAVIEAMGAGKVDIGWLATFSYVLAKQKYDVDLMLIVVRFGSPFYRGQIVTRTDSGIQKLSDLKGKTFAFVDPASTSGHLYPKTLLLSKGLNPDRLFAQSRFAGSHNAVILSVLKGEVDAGATYDDARAAVAKTYPEVYEKLRVIAYTKDIPNDTVSARKDLDPAIKQKIKSGLLQLAKTPEGSKVLKRVYGISGLMDFDAFFDPVREAGRLLDLDLKKTSP